MALSTENKQEIVKKFQRDTSDTGSTEVQVALLTAQIEQLTKHLKEHRHDFHSKRGLVAQVNQRRKLLRYLEKNDAPRYRTLIEALGLRK
jgi:small subunit ribosomal protein S15